MKYPGEEFLYEEIDKKLAEYLELKKSIKSMTYRIDELSSWLKMKGSFSTDMYVCSVEMRSRTGLVGLEEITKILTKEIVEKLKLVRTSEFLLVHVSKK